MSEMSGNSRINAIALGLERQLLANVQPIGGELTDPKVLGIGARGPVIAALDQGGAEPLVAALAHHVTSMAILYEPDDPSKALDRLEKFMAFVELGDTSPDAIREATTAIAGAGSGSLDLVERLLAAVEKLAARVSALEAERNTDGGEASS